jgi:hypothetical protein
MTDQPSKWVTIREAALALAVSELTIRRRIKDGRLTHRLLNGKYYVDLQAGPGAPDARDELEAHLQAATTHHGETPSPVSNRSAGRVAEAASAAQLEPAADSQPDALRESAGDGSPARPFPPGFNLDALLEEHTRLAETAGRARLLEEQLAQLSERHEELRSGMLSLAGRNGWLESKLEERESELRLLTDEHHRASWWRRLFRA